jgi:hypothetical protein
VTRVIQLTFFLKPAIDDSIQKRPIVNNIFNLQYFKKNIKCPQVGFFGSQYYNS